MWMQKEGSREEVKFRRGPESLVVWEIRKILRIWKIWERNRDSANL